MGYTHYWRLKLPIENYSFDNALEDIRKIVKASPVPLAGFDGNGDPDLDGKVSFNGKGDDDSHETFRLDRLAKPYTPDNNGESFDFCKTAYKPYDIVVVACLCVLQEKLGDRVRVSSDGGVKDWEKGRELAEKVLGRKIEIPKNVD